eukprot:149997_1
MYMSFLSSSNKNTTRLLIILISFLIHITFSSGSINTAYSLLSPFIPQNNNGVSVQFNINEVEIHGSHWDVNMLSEYGWNFIIQTEIPFGGIHTPHDSTLEFTTNLFATPKITELLFAFTSDNKKYIAILIPMDFTFDNSTSNIPRENQIYPSCTLTHTSVEFGMGDIASIPQTDRSCDIAGGDCTNWENMQPFNEGYNFEIPNKLTFRFEYTADSDEILLVYESSTFDPGFVQKCRLAHQFVSSNYMKMYVSGHSVHDKLHAEFAVSSFE